MSSRSAEVYEEGVRLPGVLLYSGGEPNTSLFEVLDANSRAGEDLLGDLSAKVVACNRGAEGYHRLIRKYGRDAVQAYGQHLIAYTARQVRAAIQALPDGEWFGEVQIDDDGAHGPGPKIVQRLTIRDDTMAVDYTGTDPQVNTAINMPPAMTLMRIVEPVRNVLGLDVPVNGGLWDVVDLKVPEGTILNPRFPAAVGARALSGFAQRDLLLATLSSAAPDRVPAADCGPNGILVYTAPEPGKVPKFLFDLYLCGCGGRPNADGPDGGGSNVPGGGLLETPVEAIERQLPVRFEAFGFATDTGGAGKFRSSMSIVRSWRFLQDGNVHMRNYHFEQVAYGVAGGQHGSRSRVYWASDGKTTELTGESHIEIAVKAGDVITHVFAGGGGHGDPRERDPHKVLDDVLDGKLSGAYAEREYGVVIDLTTGQVDERATRALREDPNWKGTVHGEPSVRAVSSTAERA
jgi:N-methylhydantoinase B